MPASTHIISGKNGHKKRKFGRRTGFCPFSLPHGKSKELKSNLSESLNLKEKISNWIELSWTFYKVAWYRSIWCAGIHYWWRGHACQHIQRPPLTYRPAIWHPQICIHINIHFFCICINIKILHRQYLTSICASQMLAEEFWSPPYLYLGKNLAPTMLLITGDKYFISHL